MRRQGTAKAAREGTGTLRADAQHNRQRIVEVARAALVTAHDVSMNTVAQQAGVGPGTLYRHFPTREALLLAVYREDLHGLVELAPALLGQHAPEVALRQWLDRLASYGRVKHGLAGAFSAATSADLSREGYGPVVGAIGLLLRAGQGAGTVRPDVGAEELLLLLGFLWRIEPEDWEARAAHLLDLVMDGLRAR